MLRRPPRSALIPYTTLCRSARLIATLYRLVHMHEKYGEDQFAQLYAWASAYAAQHSKAGPIGAALD